MDNWVIPTLKIGNLEVKLIQGGMGVGVSLSELASAVANEGGAGIIATVGIGALKGYPGSYVEANKAALADEIRKARSKTKGVVGVNVMHALTDYADLVRTAVEENVDLIISGAGIPKDLPSYLNGKDIKLVPIVSSARLADMLCKAWGGKLYNHFPDAIVVEGPKAGGHLGYSMEQLVDPDYVEHGLERIVPEVVEVVKKYEQMAGRAIPVIGAGGIFYGGDIARMHELGAAGVQMATRFVTTPECDADMKFKMEYVKSQKEDIVLIKSPVGMPGRAIDNQFLREVREGRKDFVCGYQCLKTCDPSKSPYCIAEGLFAAQKGELENGFAFCGTNAWRCKNIVPVKEVFRLLNEEYKQGIRSD